MTRTRTTTALIYPYSPERQLNITTPFDIWEHHGKIAQELQKRGVTARTSKSKLGLSTIVQYDAGVRERDAIRWLARMLKDVGFSPVLDDVYGEDPRPL